MQKTLLLLVVLLFSACAGTKQSTQNSAAKPFEFTILQLNDVYEIAPLEGGKVGGMARVATLLRQLEAENPNTIAVLSGDFLSPSFMGTLKMETGEKIAGLQMISTMNAVGIDYVTFGNHEFDLSDPDLLQKRIDQCQFKFACTNVRRLKDGQEINFTQFGQAIPDFQTHTFKHMGQDIKVSILGVVIPFTQKSYLKYLPVVESFKNGYQNAQKVSDLVIAMTHLSVAEDMQLAAAVPGIPLFMGGHEHENLSRYVEQTAILKADANAKTAYVHRVTFDPNTKLTRIKSTLVTIDDKIAEDPEVKKEVESWQAKVNRSLEKDGYEAGRVVAIAKSPLDGLEAHVRNFQTNYGRYTLQAFEAEYPNMDVYALNGGSMRIDDKIAGEITEYDVLRTYPFGGGFVIVDMNGAELIDFLNTVTYKNKNDGGYHQLLHAQEANGGWQVKGVPIDKGNTYKVALTEYVAGGGEANLGYLKNIKSTKPELPNCRNDVRDLVIKYFKAQGTLE